MRWIVLAALVLLPNVALAGNVSGQRPVDPELAYLLSCLEGHFASAAPAEAESEGAARDGVRLDIVRIWQDRSDGPWFYEERARESDAGHPGTQRVLKVWRTKDGSFVIRSFGLREPLKWAGEQERFEPLVALSPKDLDTTHPCETHLAFREGVLVGPATCPADLAGGGGATSELVIRPDRMETGERGSGRTATSAPRPTHALLKAPTPPPPLREMRPGH